MSMKVVGDEEKLPSYWERFDRLQRTAGKLRGTQGAPRGVFRFTSFAEFEEWKRHHQSRPARPEEKTSFPSAEN
jgi:hypothetical protein